MYNFRLEFEKGHPMNLIAKLLMNSIYGKFGMKMDVTRVDIFDISDDLRIQEFKEKLEVFKETILDYIKLDQHIVIVRDSIVDLRYNEGEDMYFGLDVNIAIASAITAGARIHMSLFKNNPEFKLYYSDTDSGVFNRQLPAEYVGNELGQFKLEHVINRAVFLAPKVYGLLTQEGNEIIKVKGISNDLISKLHLQDLENLLVQDSSKEFSQEKWFKKCIEGEITVSEVAYTLKVTSNKRQAIYINNVFENTKPYNYDELNNKQ